MEVIKRNLIGRVDSVRTSFIELRKLKRKELLFIFWRKKLVSRNLIIISVYIIIVTLLHIATDR